MPNKTKQNTKNSTEQICSQPLYKSQTTHHTHPSTQETLRPGMQATTTKSGGRSHGVEREPDSVSARINFYAQPKHAPTPTTHIRWRTHAGTRKQPNTPTNRPPCCIVPQQNGLPRKEVIQPHLPVRLPCYDFVPIANPTFDHGLRVKKCVRNRGFSRIDL